MSQTSFDDDDLFGEAAEEMSDDVEQHLAEARAELPTPDSIWETSADNVLGVLNGLKSALDVGEAADHLRQAKKWFTLGSRADAFENPEELQAEIETVEELLETVDSASDEVSELTATIPALRGDLADAHEAAEAADADSEESVDAAETEATEEGEKAE
ncbi:hypothetical protein halTADL_0296 [Halohasta litchfieldiae]|jgi:hypothetical protein|uniref:Uncharacterized protein n=1 Tax=Halohasta litchfieldiae TaxID=1073996 RepID=A0A1H6UBA0_9EURY|nr:DUF5790 family protein [Halohasta litchfieldiae]ATW87112.1 hypothetical protein halTADL_0296 [Halohasta litchfieldiae]SEI85505.1 hypothetical protein SAMN05444271_109113 [Halohasta litchfieldiae]